MYDFEATISTNCKTKSKLFCAYSNSRLKMKAEIPDLTSLLAKCMESFIRESVIQHMLANNLFLDDQHGFVPGRLGMI